MKIKIEPPLAEKNPKALTYHNEEFIDDYYWLREKENPKVIQYLEDENAYTNSKMADSLDLQKQLFSEIKARVKEDDSSVPVLEDGYFYYTRTEEGQQYKIHCRKKQTLDAEEEVLLDENILAKGKEYFVLGEFTISQDNQLLAYSIDSDGSEKFEVFVLNLFTRESYPISIPETYYGLEWSNDNCHLYYTKLDDAHRPYQIWKHNIQKNIRHDQLIFEELDEAYFVDISKSKDHQFIFADVTSQVTSEIHFLDANNAESKFKCITPRQYAVEYNVDHYKGEFHLLSNLGSSINFQWFKTKIDTVSAEEWTPVLPYEKEHYLLELDFFEDYIVLEERYNGLKQIRVFQSDLKQQHVISFDEQAYAVSLGDNPEYATDQLRLSYRSMVTPNTTYDYDMGKRELTVRKVQEIPSGYDSSKYESKRVDVLARDGEKIPVSFVYRKDQLTQDGNPLYLYAYGSYGISVDPFFSVAQISLMDRGFIFAIAHIRGGSDKGRDWYENGKFLHKKNTFYDFIDVGQYFVNQGLTTSDLLVANGGSAGGLLMGAVANMAPDLFHAIVADVPFVDVVHTMMDESIPLTVIEYDEWGNPNEKLYFNYMKSYSPYDNVQQKEYPHLLVTAGLNDPRVQYWEPAKWVAKLRDFKTDDHLLLLKTNMDAGHAGKSGRFERIKETAFEFAFLLKVLGLER